MRHTHILLLSIVFATNNYIYANLDCGDATVNGEGCEIKSVNTGTDYTIQTDITTNSDSGNHALFIDKNNINISFIGNIETSGASSQGVVMWINNGNTMSIFGDITTEGPYSYGLYSDSDSNNSLSMTGDIITNGFGSCGLLNFMSTNNTNSITGDITTNGNNTKGIRSLFTTNHTTSMTGDIITNGDNAYGIEYLSTDSTISMTGDIISNGDNAHGIFDESTDSTISMTGDIISNGDNAYGIYNYRAANSTTSITGDITTSGEAGFGILFRRSSGNSTLVTGNITTSGINASGVTFGTKANNETVTIKGDIAANGDTIVFGEVDPATNNIINIHGTVSSTNLGNGIRVVAGSTNNTINFGRGSKFIGSFINNSDNTNTIQFDMGAASSYVFSVNNDWNLNDTSKSVVSGSANSRSVADIDDTYNRLYQRFIQLENALVFQHQANHKGNQQPYWISGYENRSERTLLNSEIDAKSTGLSLGYQLNDHWDIIANAERIEVEYGSSEHSVNTTSALVGFYSPHYKALLNGSLSLKLLASFAKNEGELTVLNNTIISGVETVSDSYNTMALLGGAEWLGTYSKNNSFRQYTHLGLNLIYENQPKYETSKYFVMNENHTTQLNASLKHALSFQLTNSRYNLNAFAGVTYVNILSGEEHTYAITSLNNITTETSYTATKDALYYEGGCTLDYRSSDKTTAQLNIQISKANEMDIDGLSGGFSIHMKR